MAQQQFNPEAFTSAILAAHRYTVDSNHASYEKALQAIVSVLGPGGQGSQLLANPPPLGSRAQALPAPTQGSHRAQSGGQSGHNGSAQGSSSRGGSAAGPSAADSHSGASEKRPAEHLTRETSQSSNPSNAHTHTHTSVSMSASPSPAQFNATLSSAAPMDVAVGNGGGGGGIAAPQPLPVSRKRRSSSMEAGVERALLTRRRRTAETLPVDFKNFLKMFKRYLLREHVSAFTGQKLAPVTVNYRIAAAKRLLTKAWIPTRNISELNLVELEKLRNDHETDRNSLNAIGDLNAFFRAQDEGGLKLELDEAEGEEDDDDELEGPRGVTRGRGRARSDVPSATRGLVRWLRRGQGREKVSGSTAYSYQTVFGNLLKCTGADLKNFKTEDDLRTYVLEKRQAIEAHIPEMRQPYPKERAAWKKVWEYMSGEKIWAEEGNFWSNRAGGGSRRKRRRVAEEDIGESDEPDYGVDEDEEGEEEEGVEEDYGVDVGEGDMGDGVMDEEDDELPIEEAEEEEEEQVPAPSPTDALLPASTYMPNGMTSPTDTGVSTGGEAFEDHHAQAAADGLQHCLLMPPALEEDNNGATAAAAVGGGDAEGRQVGHGGRSREHAHGDVQDSDQY